MEEYGCRRNPKNVWVHKTVQTRLSFPPPHLIKLESLGMRPGRGEESGVGERGEVSGVGERGK